MKVRLTAQARAELEDIRRWIARDDPAAALSFTSKLRSRIADLQYMSEGYPVAVVRDGNPVMRMNYKSYRVLYEVSNGEVSVLHVHHGRRRYPDLA